MPRGRCQVVGNRLEQLAHEGRHHARQEGLGHLLAQDALEQWEVTLPDRYSAGSAGAEEVGEAVELNDGVTLVDGIRGLVVRHDPCAFHDPFEHVFCMSA